MLYLHAWQMCTFFKSYMQGSFFTAFCHMLLHFVTCFYMLSFFFPLGLIWQHEHVLSQGSSNSNTSKLTPTKMDTKRITTETTPSSNHTSPNQLSNSSKKNLFDKQHKDIDYLVKKVRYLEGKISELEGCLFVTL